MTIRNYRRRMTFAGAAVIAIMSLLLSFTIPNQAVAADSILMEKAVQFLNHDYANNGVNNSDAGVGSYALFVLTQAGIDVGDWKHDGVNLKDAVINTVGNDAVNADKVPAKRLAQDLAVAKILGQNEIVDKLIQNLKSRQKITGFDDSGALSIYSNMPSFEIISRVSMLDRFDLNMTKNYIFSAQNKTENDKNFGSWGSLDDGKYYADFNATTEAIRTLYSMDIEKKDQQIQKAIADGLNWIKKQQKNDGSFVAGMDDPLIDTCEVLVTLKTLGRNQNEWVSGTGKSPMDYFMNSALNADGSFGSSQNDMDAIWAIWTCRALQEEINTYRQSTPANQISSSQNNFGEKIFKDIRGHWAEQKITDLAKLGIITGYKDGTFVPEGKVTRNEIIAMMVKMLNSEPASTQDLNKLKEKFSDAEKIPGWAEGNAAIALREGIVSGYQESDGTFNFNGDTYISRAELATILGKIIEQKLGQATIKTLDFTDMDRIPGWAKTGVGIDCAHGIIGGYPDGSFRPDNTVVRAEAASMIWQTYELLQAKKN